MHSQPIIGIQIQNAALWLERREEQGYPLGLVPAADTPKPAAPKSPAADGARTFVFEIGSEELPPDDVLLGMAQLRWGLFPFAAGPFWVEFSYLCPGCDRPSSPQTDHSRLNQSSHAKSRRERVPALLQKLRLPHASVAVHGTPRRLAVVVSGLAARQEAQEGRVRGPPAKAAFDAAGKPTKVRGGLLSSRLSRHVETRFY
jgi:glycyl-tRNA synthetase